MSLDTIVDLKRATLQSRIDSLNAREIVLSRKLTALGSQSDGALDQAGGFQRAAMARRTAQTVSVQLNNERQQIISQRTALLREQLSLDIAAEKLSKLAKAQKRLDESRADLKG